MVPPGLRFAAASVTKRPVDADRLTVRLLLVPLPTRSVVVFAGHLATVALLTKRPLPALRLTVLAMRSSSDLVHPRWRDPSGVPTTPLRSRAPDEMVARGRRLGLGADPRQRAPAPFRVPRGALLPCESPVARCESRATVGHSTKPNFTPPFECDWGGTVFGAAPARLSQRERSRDIRDQPGVTHDRTPHGIS